MTAGIVNLSNASRQNALDTIRHAEEDCGFVKRLTLTLLLTLGFEEYHSAESKPAQPSHT